MVVVGVLALQGDYEAHARAVEALGHRVQLVKSAEPLDDVDALLLPGGESSTMLRFLEGEALLEPLAKACRSGRPVLGTCAGAILLAHGVNPPTRPTLSALDIDVLRNGYGRQRESFITRIDDSSREFADMEAVFIRAPIIERTGADVEILVRHDERPVLVRQGSVWAATFHPEMTSDTRLLQRVLAS